MDTELLVDNRIDDGQKLVSQLVRDGFDVLVAFWVKTSEEGLWHFYIASPAVNVEKIGEAYRAAYASLSKVPDPSVSLSEIKLVSPENPITRDVLDILRRSPSGRLATRSRRPNLGGIASDEVYIYPPPPREKRGPITWEKRRLTTPVEQKVGMEARLDPFDQREKNAFEQIVASGVSPTQAEFWVRKKREERSRPSIPAGTVVKARVTAWWGDHPEDDPNPLLLVEADDGVQGLTFKNDTEPV